MSDTEKRLLARLSALRATRLRNDPELFELMDGIGDADELNATERRIMLEAIGHRIGILEGAAKILKAEARR